MNMLDGMRSQLLSELLSRRLITSLADASVNANDAGLVRFVLVRTSRSPNRCSGSLNHSTFGATRDDCIYSFTASVPACSPFRAPGALTLH